MFNHFTMIKVCLQKQQEQPANLIPLDDIAEVQPADSCDLLLKAMSLPIAKVLVELHGGHLWVESKQERGNNFCFTLPKPAELKKEPSMKTASASLR